MSAPIVTTAPAVWPKRSKPSVIQLNAHLVAERRDGAWHGTADLGLGLVAKHKSSTASSAITGALKFALAELEARHG